MSDEPHDSKTRRLTVKGAATRQRIVAAAADLMYTQGVEFTSIDDVIEASGTGKSQIYHYFTDKNALVDAVVKSQVQRVLGEQAPLLDDLRSMRGFERWRDFVVAGLRGWRGTYGCPIGSLASEIAHRSEAVRGDLERGYAAWERSFRTGLERMQSSGELKPDANTEELAIGLMAAMQGGYLLAKTRREHRSMAVALDMALDRIRAELASHP